jgi:iron-sulfur cluster assembly protein
MTIPQQFTALPVVKLTPAAVRHFQKMAQDAPNQYIILDVKKTGCSGLKYSTHLQSELQPGDTPVAQHDDLPLYMSEKAMPYLSGIVVDYEVKGLGQKGLRYSNPNETGRCGCGESFTTDSKFLQGDE